MSGSLSRWLYLYLSTCVSGLSSIFSAVGFSVLFWRPQIPAGFHWLLNWEQVRCRVNTERAHSDEVSGSWAPGLTITALVEYPCVCVYPNDDDWQLATVLDSPGCSACGGANWQRRKGEHWQGRLWQDQPNLCIQLECHNCCRLLAAALFLPTARCNIFYFVCLSGFACLGSSKKAFFYFCVYGSLFFLSLVQCWW